MWRSVKDDPPTIQNCGNRKGEVLLGYDDSKHVSVGHFYQISKHAIYWHPIEPPPKRKIWREATQADLDKATEPIPCRVRDDEHEKWTAQMLLGVVKFSDHKFATSCCRWRFCEIQVEE